MILFLLIACVCAWDLDIVPSRVGPSNPALFSVKHIGRLEGGSLARGVMFTLSNPMGHFSVIPPDGGCANNSRTKASVTAQEHNCHVATNAGFFDTERGTCIGNLVSEGNFIQGSEWINPIFGITEYGTIVAGYAELSVEKHSIEYRGRSEAIVEAVSGVLWIVRDGKRNVLNATRVEDPRAQSTGSLEYFASVVSARTAVGVTGDGEVVIVSVEGKTGIEGIDLFDLADIMIDFGVVSAVNLDGGGSATAIEDGMLVEMPSDQCPDLINGKHLLFCERKVTSIMCIHDLVQ